MSVSLSWRVFWKSHKRVDYIRENVFLARRTVRISLQFLRHSLLRGKGIDFCVCCREVGALLSCSCAFSESSLYRVPERAASSRLGWGARWGEFLIRRLRAFRRGCCLSRYSLIIRSFHVGSPEVRSREMEKKRERGRTVRDADIRDSCKNMIANAEQRIARRMPWLSPWKDE